MPSRRKALAWLATTALASSGPAARAAGNGNVTGIATDPGAPDNARWRPWPAARAVPPLRLPDLQGQEWDLAQGQGGGAELLGHLVRALPGRDGVL